MIPSSRVPQEKIPLLRLEAFVQLPWLIHGFSTRSGGVSKAYGGEALNLGYTRHDSHAAVDANRVALLKSLGAVNQQGAPWPLVRLRQIHSDLVHTVDHVPEQALTGDGLLTAAPHLMLAVQTADCLPVLLVDREHKAVGAFHAGWRGTLARIVEKGVGMMRLNFGSKPEQLSAAIGPGIGACCYSVGEEVRGKFDAQFAYARQLFREKTESGAVREKYPLLFLTARAPGHGDAGRTTYLDLREANRRQLLAVGMRPVNIHVLDLCTACRIDLFFSHRAQKGVTGRQMAVIGISRP